MIEKYDNSKHVPTPRVAEWPVYESKQLPKSWKKIDEWIDRNWEEDCIWNIFFDGKMLIFYHHSEGINRFDGTPMKYRYQYEYPIEAARWFVENIKRFFKSPEDTDTLPADSFTYENGAGGEILGISRLMHSVKADIPGYSLENLSRCEHVDGYMCQRFKLSDEDLFKDDGFLALLEKIAIKYEAGLL